VKKYATALTIVLFFFLAASAYADSPLAAVKADVDQILAVVTNNNLSVQAKKEKLRGFYSDMFDTQELSRQTLGANWRKLNSSQQQQFIHLYGRLLERNYMDRILSYKNQKITYGRQIMFSDTRAEVQTKVDTDSGEVPIDYKMILANGAWKVYDVVVANVSLVLNYRSQFQEILAGKTPDQMLAELKAKVGQQS
jgi:phospholipid transport system substrate-binding protein